MKQQNKTIKINHLNKMPKNYTGIVEYPNGVKEWFLNGKRHREDGPAIEHSNGYKQYWFLNGKCHREAAPAVEYSSGYKEYWYNDKMLNKERIQFFMKDLGFPIKTAVKLTYLKY